MVLTARQYTYTTAHRTVHANKWTLLCINFKSIKLKKVTVEIIINKNKPIGPYFLDFNIFLIHLIKNTHTSWLSLFWESLPIRPLWLSLPGIWYRYSLATHGDVSIRHVYYLIVWIRENHQINVLKDKELNDNH